MAHKFWFGCTNLHSRLFWGSFFPIDYYYYFMLLNIQIEKSLIRVLFEHSNTIE